MRFMKKSERITDDWLEVLAIGCLSPHHATQFKGFIKQIKSKYQLSAILKGDISWPIKPEDRDVLYFLAQSLRAQLIKELPQEQKIATGSQKDLAHRAKSLL